ncbi:MAG: 30S ribosomal protein S26e [Nitrososphaerota archaeon]|jgi:small subunit ribosomal protein S26e|nr:30S ribosomal protein S26e [Nitrososphaerota archaeon]
MPVKRKSRGRTKGSKGSNNLVQCVNCGAMVLRDKAKRSTRRVSFVEPQLAKELRQKGTFLASWVDTKYYCISCAVHRGIVKVRAESERHSKGYRRR